MARHSTPFGAVHARGVIVATADQLATQAAMAVAARGGNAVDAAIGANAALAVCDPHLCGMGGDLFALIWSSGAVHALNASGRAGSNADAERLRAEGHATMPFRHHPASVTVPGCVDGWIALHDRFGTLSLAEILGPAIDLAERGFPASPLLAHSVRLLDADGARNLASFAEQAREPRRLVRRPGVGEALRNIAERGRDGFYGGAFGEGLLRLEGVPFTADDLATSQADWVEPLTAPAFGVDLHTIGPNSQGYLTLGGARVADRAGLPSSPDEARWAHLLVESAIVAGHDRPQVLHEHADGRALLAAIDARAGDVDVGHATGRRTPAADGDTTYLCAADESGLAISLIQSNASGFGSWLAEPHTGINLHNRGLGFSLEPGHPAEFGPNRRPPHTLSPLLVTSGGELRAVLGTMGGDAQPQILLQLVTRLFHDGASVAEAVAAPRWALRGESTGFDTWAAGRPTRLAVEGHAPDAWQELAELGYDVVRTEPFQSEYGHAHAIIPTPSGFAGAHDPRSVIGSTAGL